MKKTIVRPNEDDYMDCMFLGNGTGEVNGTSYIGRFTGKGWVDSDYDEGSFIANCSTPQLRRKWSLIIRLVLK